MRKGVMRPGHVQLRVLDIEEAVVHYRDRLGMIEVQRDDQGRVYLKGWTEIDAWSVVLRPAEEAGMDFMGFKVLDAETLAARKQDLIEYGCEVETIPAGELDGCGERIRFQVPTGHSLELFAEKEQTGKWGVGDNNPEAWPEDLKGMRATRHGQTHGQTIYFFDPSGNRTEVFAGGDYTYPDHPTVTWDADKLGKAIFYHDRELNENFLGVVT